MSNQKPKWKIYQEDAKTRQTSHWDWDYMSADEIDALMKKRREQDEKAASKQAETGRKKLTRLILVAGMMATIAVILKVIIF